MGRAELAVIVLSYREPPQAVLAAVDSVLGQSESVELVVSHSGPAATVEVLESERPRVPVLASARRRLPGAARNAGIDGTSAPYVAFLAADCRARPGWVAARLAAHRRGAQAVASRVVPADRGAVSLASCLLTDGYRLPGIRARQQLRFGVSYARAVLERFGPFPEEVEFAEDSILNKRLLSAGVAIELTDAVVTEHAYPTTVPRLLRDQLRRGRMRGRLDLPAPARARARAYLIAVAIGEAALGVRRAQRSPAVHPATAARSISLLIAGAIARAAGILVGGDPEPAAAAELEYRRWAAARA